MLWSWTFERLLYWWCLHTILPAWKRFYRYYLAKLDHQSDRCKQSTRHQAWLDVLARLTAQNLPQMDTYIHGISWLYGVLWGLFWSELWNQLIYFGLSTYWNIDILHPQYRIRSQPGKREIRARASLRIRNLEYLHIYVFDWIKAILHYRRNIDAWSYDRQHNRIRCRICFYRDCKQCNRGTECSPDR